MFIGWTSGVLPSIGALWSFIADNYKEIGSVGGNWVQLVVGGGAVFSLIMRYLRIESMMGQPLRSARRETRKKVRKILGSPDLKTMMKMILIDLEGRKTTPSDILADWLNDPKVLYGKQQKAVREYHLGWKDISGALEDLMNWAAKPQKTGFLNRILIPVESRLLGQRFGEMATLARQFSRCQPVSKKRREHYPKRDLAAVYEVSFRRFATAFSGAAVLVDTVQTRSRYAERALVWHSRQYFGGVGKESRTGNVEGWNTEPSDYGYEHGDRGCCLWRTEGPGDGGGAGIRPGGDYDLRVLDLQSVALGEATTGGYMSLILETTESCYAATESGDTWGCKKVPLSRPVAKIPRFATVEDGVIRCPKEEPQERPSIVMLTSYVSLITKDGYLALVKRSRKVRNGPLVVSASAGGVVEPGDPGPTGHVDASGMPDPIECVIQEAKEELGLELPATSISPVAVFIANILDREVVGNGGNNSSYSEKGQIVATVLSLARIPQDREELIKRFNSHADPARGAFEVDNFEFFRISKKRKKMKAGDQQNDSGDREIAYYIADRAYRKREELDQHGVLSLLYAAAVVAGPILTKEAFSEKFSESPWWVMAADDPKIVSVEWPYRVVVDPRNLLLNEDLRSAGPDKWNSIWDRMPRTSLQ